MTRGLVLGLTGSDHGPYGPRSLDGNAAFGSR